MIIGRLTYCIIFCLMSLPWVSLGEGRATSNASSTDALNQTTTSAQNQDIDSMQLFRRMEKSYLQQKESTKVDRTPSSVLPAEQLHKGFRDGTESRFEKLKALFDKANKPSLEMFKADAVLAGKCVHRFDPELLLGSRADVYLVKGRERVYFIPEVGAETFDLKQLKEDAEKTHAQNKQKIGDYSPLQDKVQSDLPLNLILSLKSEKKLTFVYGKNKKTADIIQPKRNPAEDTAQLIELDISDKEKELGEQVYFGIRMNKMPNGSKVLLLEHLCLTYPGCYSKDSGKKRLIPYGDPYLYCYFNKGIPTPHSSTKKKKEK